MKNYKMNIEFDGGKYKGWQKSPNTDLTIQTKLEQVLSKMAGSDILVIGGERTAIGVHAMNYIANFQTSCELDADGILRYLYEFLPEDIVVKSVEEVDSRFHSKYNVKSKTYLYRINNSKRRNVFNRKYVFHTYKNLNLELMKQAASAFVGTHDFDNFDSSTSKTKSTIKTINYLTISEKEDFIEIEINANDFLSNMPRIIVGALMEVGERVLSLKDIEELLERKKKFAFTPMAKAKGLFLKEMKY